MLIPNQPNCCISNFSNLYGFNFLCSSYYRLFGDEIANGTLGQYARSK